MRLLAYATLLGASLVSSTTALASSEVSASIARAVADPARVEAQVKTDVDRQPAQTLAFAEVKRGMLIGEMFPGGGYFTQLLSNVVGPEGHVYGIENDGWQDAVKEDRDMATFNRAVFAALKPGGTF